MSGARRPTAEVRYFVTIQGDEFTLGPVAAGSVISVVCDGGAARVRRAIGRTGKRRYDAPAADDALAVDFAAAGFSERVSRVRAARARGQTLQLVRHWPVAAHAACGSRRHMDRELAHFFRLRRRSGGAQHHRQLQHEHFGDRVDGADRLPVPRAVAIQRERIGGGRPGVAFLHHAPALHTEHDGEQFHHAADLCRNVLSVRVAADRQRPGVCDWVVRAGVQPADSGDDGARLAGRGIFSADRALDGAHSRAGVVAASGGLLQGGGAGLSLLRDP